MHDDDGEARVMGGGSIVGVGVVSGKRAVILASDSAIKGGTISPMGLKKSLRAQEIAAENKLPLIYLIELGGANLLVSERDVCGRRALVCEPGAAFGGRHSTNSGGAWLLDGRRRLSAGPCPITSFW